MRRPRGFRTMLTGRPGMSMARGSIGGIAQRLSGPFSRQLPPVYDPRMRSLTLLALLTLAACGKDEATEPRAVCAPTPITCEDQSIQQLNLQTDPAPGLI